LVQQPFNVVFSAKSGVKPSENVMKMKGSKSVVARSLLFVESQQSRDGSAEGP